MRPHYKAIHPTWESEMWLREDGRFFGGGKKPHGEWKVEGDNLVLHWFHWPEEPLRKAEDGWVGDRLQLVAIGPLLPLHLISFEIGLGCNLSGRHPDCPVNQPDRHPVHDRPFTDEEFALWVRLCQKKGFQGYVGFHGFNEPMVDIDRLEALMIQLRGCGLVLRTNGAVLTEENKPFLLKFDRVILTQKEIPVDLAGFPNLSHQIHPIPLYKYDSRWRCYQPCRRPTMEMLVDFYGNLRTCSVDWKGTNLVGSLSGSQLGDWDKALQNFTRLRLTNQWALEEMPPVCLSCPVGFRR